MADGNRAAGRLGDGRGVVAVMAAGAVHIGGGDHPAGGEVLAAAAGAGGWLGLRSGDVSGAGVAGHLARFEIALGAAEATVGAPER